MKMSDSSVCVIGAGLAGAEAAWQIARRGVAVRLVEMKPTKHTPAHRTDGFAELVCSNSLRSDQLSNAVGLLKAEMRLCGSLIMEAADATRVPAGSALAVDRERFSAYVTEKLRSHPLISVEEGCITSVPEEGITLIATGPLTDSDLAEDIARLSGREGLSFFDAAAPIVDAATVNRDIAFFASRYGKGDGDDYLNCPMTESEYRAFYEALISAEEAPLHDFDREEQKDLTVFEGCMPVEVMAKRGFDTLRFGPLKSVGLPLPETGKEAYAVVQLRRENTEGTMYNLVGFQTHLTFGEQKRVFRMIPGLENAEFLRYGVMHRNTYLNSPGFLNERYEWIQRPGLFFAGQMTGVEGYVESAGSGLVAGISAALLAKSLSPVTFPDITMLGAMAHYVSGGGLGAFQPMNANFGIIAPLDRKVKGGKKLRNEAYSERSLALLEELIKTTAL